jgi:hypothetical protein
VVGRRTSYEFGGCGIGTSFEQRAAHIAGQRVRKLLLVLGAHEIDAETRICGAVLDTLFDIEPVSDVQFPLLCVKFLRITP